MHTDPHMNLRQIASENWRTPDVRVFYRRFRARFRVEKQRREKYNRKRSHQVVDNKGSA
jgi:putative heme degradation protein